MASPLIDLTKLNMETLEAFFPSENPAPKGKENGNAEEGQKSEAEFEIRRKLFFGK
jgi:hypothetical protein